MLFANDKNGNRVYAIDAEPGKEYFCPICNSKVVLKSGEVNIPHFAHKNNTCYDDWNYDMSYWHKKRQSFFPKECQEVIVKNEFGQIHRADVLVGNTVIEFQHSNITASEFDARNDFFLGLGYRLVWVFDISDEFNKNIEDKDWDRRMYKWNYPKRIFQNAPKLSDSNKKFSLWFSVGYEEDDFNISKVVWAAKDEEKYNFKCFIFGESLDLDELDSVEQFFPDKYGVFKKLVEDLRKKTTYKIKYIGQKGYGLKYNQCPVTKTWASENAKCGKSGCLHCKHCGLVKINLEKGNKKTYDSYCCYPTVIKTPDSGDPEYEVSWVEQMEFNKY